ncbi:MAG: response regulator, partial [Mitsuokella jalaludinii]|nr:response regulator [Mitsuokella jalaludinii]
MYRVMLVEKDRLMLEKLSAVIERTPDFSMAVRYQNKQDALGQGRMFDPNLILLDIDDENAVPLIEAFHKSYPRADILGMAAEWRPESATHLIGAGARGCLIKPFTGVELQEAVREFVTEGSEKDCETLVFFSPKGKSGKTTLIANLAEALARRTHEQVGIIDADLQFGDMAVFFNLTPQSTIVEAARDIRFLSPVTLKRYYMPVSERVHVLCGTTKPNYIDKVSIPQFENIIRMSRSLFRYLLIDVP